MAFNRFSRRQFAGIAGWSVARSIGAIGRIRSGRPDRRPRTERRVIRFSGRLSVGNGDLILSDRGGRQRRRPRPIDLGPLRPYARDHRRPQQRRHRDRPLSSVQGRRSVDEGAGRKGLSFFDCLAARLPGRSRPAKPEGASISTTGCWMSCWRTASSRLQPCIIGTCRKRCRIASAAGPRAIPQRPLRIMRPMSRRV